MTTTEKTPLWLHLKKEYIDDNFDELRRYLADYNGDAKNDYFYQITIDLLRQRIEDLITTISRKSIYDKDDERSKTVLNASLLATYLLSASDDQLALAAYIAFMWQLRTLNPRFADATIKMSVNRLMHEKVTNYGFKWEDLEAIGSELFAHKATHNAEFDIPRRKPLVFSKFGTALITSGGLFLTHETESAAKKILKKGSNSLDTGLNIFLRTDASQKLKQSHESQIPEMEKYIQDFIHEQEKIKNKKQPPILLKSYSDNDEVVVRVSKIENGTISVETTDPKYQKLAGSIEFDKQSLVYYYTNTLHEYFTVGDYLKVTIKDITAPTFTFEDQLVEFFVEDTKEVQSEGNEFLAKLIDEKPEYYGWITASGIAMYTPNSGQYQRGDFAWLEVKGYGQGKYFGKIDATILESSDESFDEKQVRHDCIRAFAEMTKAPEISKEEEDTNELSPAVLALLLLQLFSHQKTLLNPSDRYSVLGIAGVIAETLGDRLSASYIKFERTYLRALVQFVAGRNINEIHLIPDDTYKDAISTRIKLSVIDLLKEYGRKDDSEKLDYAATNFQDTLPMISKLARLIRTSNSMQGILTAASLNVIKREIIKTLSLETEDHADLETDNGTYLGIESGTQEFKTSIIFPPDNNMQPDEFAQNQNILKGVCAFLNSTIGGVLYLGVNDLGYVVGLDNDMKHLGYTEIDSYQRYVQDTIKQHFGVDVLQFIRIEPLYENRVVAIHIDPHPYRVVELDDTAYLRVNAESREMPENVRRQLIDQKMFRNKDAAAATSRLLHACAQKKCVVLHDYASSNSGKIADRYVEAYDIKTKAGLIVCYDIWKKDVCVFKINRIKWVEIKENEPWKNTDKHKEIKIDVFHMSGVEPIPICLTLDLFAKNLLVEEFPKAEVCVKPDKGDNNTWYFSTQVYSLEGIGRFCMGLIDHIDVSGSPELKEYLVDYAAKVKAAFTD